MHRPDDVLLEGLIHLQAGILIEAGVLDVGYDTHDRDPVIPLPAVADSLAERVLVRPVLSHQALVDDRDRWSGRMVSVGEGAAVHDARADGIEVAGRHITNVPHQRWL